MRRLVRASRMFVGVLALGSLSISGCATTGGGPLAGIAGNSPSLGSGSILPSQASQPSVVSNPAPGQYTPGQLASFGQSSGSYSPYSGGRSSAAGCSLG